MKIIRAQHLGMCFGVRDAIALALEHSHRSPLTILGDLVHNETVLDQLRQRGIRMANDPAAVTTRNVMITAHGASQRTIGRAQALGFGVTEATCPLVHVAHRAVARLVADGFHPVVIGKVEHVEVRGMTEDLEDYDVVLSLADVAHLRERARFGVVAQTTQPIAKVLELVEAIQARFPRSEVRFVDTVCQPTKQRQSAAAELAREADVMIIIGGAHSNNTQELVRSCRAHCSRVHHVQGPADLQETWFRPQDTVGVTAGTSTPDSLILDVERWIEKLNGQLVSASEVLVASTGSAEVDHERRRAA
jgi:4-hydroxy-3-methylbut-2-enyl diphosphate reductase